MHTSFTRTGAFALLGLGLAGLALAPQSAQALGYNPPAPDLKVIQGSAFDNGTSTHVSGNYTFAPGYSSASTSFSNGVETDGSSTALFTGGYALDLTTKDHSLATFAGGQVIRIGSEGSSAVNITGGKFQNLYTFDSSVIDLFGTNLKATPDPTFHTSVLDLSGFLSDGTPVTGFYEASQSKGGTLEFNGAPVPEASSLVSLGLLLALGSGGMVIAARRRKAARS